MKAHSGEKSHKCSQCDFATVYKSSLNKHFKSHSGEKKKSFKCDHCNYASDKSSNLKTHLRTQSEENPTNATNVTLPLFKKQFEETFENSS